MSAIFDPTAAPSHDTQVSKISMFYVILGGAALLSAVLIPIAFVFALRRNRLRSLATERLEGDLQQEEPKLFDLHVKPGLELREARLEYIFPIAVRTASKNHASMITNALSSLPSVPQTHHPSHGRDVKANKTEAPGDETQTYDIVVLIAMPHPHTTDRWSEPGGYSIGTVKITAPVFLDAPTPS